MASIESRARSVVTIPRTCDRCHRAYSFVCEVFAAASGFGATNRVGKSIKDKTAWLANNPDAITTHGVVCPHCQSITLVAQQKFFPQGYVETLRQYINNNQRMGKWGSRIVFGVLGILAICLIGGLFALPVITVDTPQEKQLIKALIIGGLGITLLASIFVRFAHRRLRQLSDRANLLLANCSERDAELFLIDTHENFSVGPPVINLDGRLKALVAYLELSATDRTQWIENRQAEWNECRKQLLSSSDPDPWLGERSIRL